MDKQVRRTRRQPASQPASQLSPRSRELVLCINVHHALGFTMPSQRCAAARQDRERHACLRFASTRRPNQLGDTAALQATVSALVERGEASGMRPAMC